MAKFERGNHDIFRDFIRAAFHHQNGIARAGNAEIEIRSINLRKGRIDDEFSIHSSNAHRADRPIPRDIRDYDRRGSSVDREYIKRVDTVGRKREHDHLYFIAHTMLEQRAQWSIREARDENRFGAGASFTPEERTGDFPTRGKSLFRSEERRV